VRRDVAPPAATLQALRGHGFAAEEVNTMSAAPLLDIEQPGKLEAYLLRTGRVAPNEIVSVEPLSGGVSNRTMLVRRSQGRDWVVKQALPRLRVDAVWLSDPARSQREALATQAIAELTPPGAVAPLVFFDPAEHLLAIQAVPQPHENWKAMLLAGRLDTEHVRQFAGLLATIHARAWRQRDRLAAPFADRSFFESLRLEPYYAYTAARLGEARGFLTALVEETRSRAETLVHGDYSPKNVLVHAGRLVLLDHEVAHWGDPAFDLGFALAHLLSKAHHVTSRRAEFADAARLFWQVYVCELAEVPWIADLEQRAVRHTLGCLLARVAGRSPLEYLNETERRAQQRAVLELLTAPPAMQQELLARFLAGIEQETA
jgi:aminoglycoside phosphotransferase (APT) family kinase protein